MALTVNVGADTTATDSAPVSKNHAHGLGTTPDLMFWLWVFGTAFGSGADAPMCFGVANGTGTKDRSIFSFTRNGGNNSESHFRDDVAHILDNNNTIDTVVVGQTTGLDATNHTINYTTTDRPPPVAHQGLFLALAGADEVNISSFNTPTSTGSTNHAHGLTGGTPDLVILGLQYTAGSDVDASTVWRFFSFGAYDGTNQWVSGTVAQDSPDPTDSSRYQSASNCVWLGWTGQSEKVRGAATGVDGTNVTINYSAVDGSSHYGFLIAVRGIQAYCGTGTQKTSTGTQGYTGVGFPPECLIGSSVMNTNSSSINTFARHVIGFCAGAGDEGCLANAVEDNTSGGLFDASYSFSNTKFLRFITENGASPSTDAECDVDSYDSDGFTLDWTTADATAREFCYIAMADTAAAGQPTMRRWGGIPGMRNQSMGRSW